VHLRAACRSRSERCCRTKARNFAELSVEILQPLATQLTLALQHHLLGRREHAIETPQHRERQDHILILATLERVADQVRNAPDEADNLAVVHQT
jgi:hypothetical protein